MPIGPLVAGVAIQTGVMMIRAGIKKVIPEIAKLLDEPRLETIIEDLEIDKLTDTLIEATRKKKTE